MKDLAEHEYDKYLSRLSSPQRHVWIVEMMLGKQWQPTTGCALTRTDGRFLLKDWKVKNPHDKFRLIAYNSL